MIEVNSYVRTKAEKRFSVTDTPSAKEDGCLVFLKYYSDESTKKRVTGFVARNVIPSSMKYTLVPKWWSCS